MPYNEAVLNRIRDILTEKQVSFTEKTMFSGVCIMVDDKMCCATHTNKKTGEDVVLCRLSPEDFATAIENPDCLPMDFSGKAMKGYVYVTERGIRTRKDLEHWLQLCLNYNPLAKKSK
ncbi:TfoX/Sxy family protein [Emticicia sp. 21SJ11W-3]|uniref:TfoX/Sxy family protein n=1 Tax=Emticicia sp. 21SJ11W-3 TaxID=2916755 RepID=UPI0020A19C94|nr:TfoX/Sxy family protein [Emticicia sp. 21SJ11W-3]UTA66451.1 TfoX/Sxy family protein [Emticicia sp. 21SJ11W-3]